MQQQTVFALVLSLSAHAVVLFLLFLTPKGSGAPDKSVTQLKTTLVYITSAKSILQSLPESKVALPTADSANETRLPTKAVTPSSPTTDKLLTSENTFVFKAQPSVSADTVELQDLYGLQGKSNITYWSFDQVDQAALMLAEWPEGLSTSAWPLDMPVSLEIWINPDGALADIAFSQKDLPDSVRITLVEAISRAGFKPAIKNGEQVGNYRMLEVLLSQTSVPPLVTY